MMGTPRWWTEIREEAIRKQDGAALRRKREALGWSRNTAATVTGFSPSYIGRVERGEVAISMRRHKIFDIAYKAALDE